MTTEKKTVCNFCGKVKGEVNHWHTLRTWTTTEGNRRMMILEFEEKTYEFPSNHESEQTDACGFQCVSQAVSRFLDHGTLEEK